MRLSEEQPEFKAPIWDYLGFLVDEQRVADGRAMMRQYDAILPAAERRFGVEPPFHRGRLGRRDGLRARGGRQRLAVDFDGDGRRDLVRSVADALGSTANYLKRSGWQPGDPWMIEVTVPRGYDGPTGRGNKSSLSSWAQRKVLRGSCQPAPLWYIRRPASVGSPRFSLGQAVISDQFIEAPEGREQVRQS